MAEPTDPPEPATDPAPDSTEPVDPPADPPADQALGEAGQKALDAFKQRARDAEKAAKAATAELDKLRKESMSDQEKAVAAARDEGRTEAITAANDRILTAEVKAAAADFIDPADALKNIDRDGLVAEDGTVDEAEIASRVAAILEAKPYMRKPEPGGKGAPVVPKGSQGAPDVLSLDDQILEAQAKGDVKRVIGLNSQKLLRNATNP